MKYLYVLEFDAAEEIRPAALATLQAHLDAQVELLCEGEVTQDYSNLRSSLTPRWTRATFIASRSYHGDIGAAVDVQLYDERGEPCTKAGYLYAGRFFLEIEKDGYCLTFGNETLSFRNLTDAEQSLFDLVCHFDRGLVEL